RRDRGYGDTSQKAKRLCRCHLRGDRRTYGNDRYSWESWEIDARGQNRGSKAPQRGLRVYPRLSGAATDESQVRAQQIRKSDGKTTDRWTTLRQADCLMPAHAYLGSMTVHFPFENTYAALPGNFFARVAPTPVTAPKLIKL